MPTELPTQNEIARLNRRQGYSRPWAYLGGVWQLLQDSFQAFCFDYDRAVLVAAGVKFSVGYEPLKTGTNTLIHEPIACIQDNRRIYTGLNTCCKLLIGHILHSFRDMDVREKDKKTPNTIDEFPESEYYSIVSHYWPGGKEQAIEWRHSL